VIGKKVAGISAINAEPAGPSSKGEKELTMVGKTSTNGELTAIPARPPATEETRQADRYRQDALRKLDDLAAGIAILKQATVSGALFRRIGADQQDVFSVVHHVLQDLEQVVAEAAIATRLARKPRGTRRRLPVGVVRLADRARLIQVFAGGVLDSITEFYSECWLPEYIADINQYLVKAEEAMGEALESSGAAARAVGARE